MATYYGPSRAQPIFNNSNFPSSSSLSLSSSDSRYLLLSGGTVSGALTVTGSETVSGSLSVSGSASVSSLAVTGAITSANLTCTGLVRCITPVMARRLSIATTINTSTVTTATWDVSDTFNYNSAMSGLSYSAGVFTNTSGETRVYSVSYTVCFAQNSSGTERSAYLAHNSDSGTTRYSKISQAGSSTSVNFIPGSCIVTLANNDTVAVYVYQDSGSSLGFGGTAAGITTGYTNRIQLVLL